MTAPLTVHNAEITTATVEIKTLTISGKQVTLAVFRQLQEDQLVAEDGALNGDPWGIVNYHPDKCGNESHHIHVVWQLGPGLRRSRVDFPGFKPFCDEGDLPGLFAQAAYCVSGHRQPTWAWRRRTDGFPFWHFVFDGVTCETFDVPDSPFNITSSPAEHTCLTQADLDEARELLGTAVAEEKIRRKRHHAQWKALNDLPQLYIAV